MDDKDEPKRPRLTVVGARPPAAPRQNRWMAGTDLLGGSSWHDLSLEAPDPDPTQPGPAMTLAVIAAAQQVLAKEDPKQAALCIVGQALMCASARSMTATTDDYKIAEAVGYAITTAEDAGLDELAAAMLAAFKRHADTLRG